jgi:1D-myo-inositol 3-kinase
LTELYVQEMGCVVASIDFLAVGHVTKDLLPNGRFTLGGTAAYATLTARSLGVSAAAMTSAPPGLDLADMLAGVQLHVIPSASPTVFENIYRGEQRLQYLRSVADRLAASDLPPAWKRASIVLLGPLVGELGMDWLGAFAHSLVGVVPQGWMRQWDRTGLVASRAWDEASLILPRVDVVVFSEDDVSRDEVAIRYYASLARVAVVTHGRRGATVFYRGVEKRFPAFRAREVDPTGAGDVFAAAFLVRLNETGDPFEAAPFANCTASLSIEGIGTTTIPTRQQVMERLRHGKHYDSES